MAVALGPEANASRWKEVLHVDRGWGPVRRVVPGSRPTDPAFCGVERAGVALAKFRRRRSALEVAMRSLYGPVPWADTGRPASSAPSLSPGPASWARACPREGGGAGSCASPALANFALAGRPDAGSCGPLWGRSRPVAPSPAPPARPGGARVASAKTPQRTRLLTLGDFPTTVLPRPVVETLMRDKLVWFALLAATQFLIFAAEAGSTKVYLP